MRRSGRMLRWTRYAWASPTTAVGLLAGALTVCSGGRPQRREGALEFHGGFSRWLAGRWGFSAMTLGHVIIGRDEWALDFCRDHEQVHVRQAELWGFAFIPAYLAASVLASWRGDHYYFDNWFERDARLACGQAEPRRTGETSPRHRRSTWGERGARCTRFDTRNITSQRVSWCGMS